MAVEVKEARADDITMRYVCFGEGSKDMVILPGLSLQSVLSSADAIAEAYGVFAKDYTVRLFDRRVNIPDRYSVEEMAEDTAKIMEFLGLENVYLFGVSQGGMMAQLIAIRHPHLVGKLVLASTASKFETAKDSDIWDKWLTFAKQGKIHELNEAFCEDLFGHELCVQLHDVVLAMEEATTKEDVDRFIVMAEGTENFDVYDDLNKITCPVLILGSENDTVLDVENMKKTANKLNCEIYLYEGYSHAVYDLAPDFKDRILRFYAGEEG